jgi:hypothetical protein
MSDIEEDIYRDLLRLAYVGDATWPDMYEHQDLPPGCIRLFRITSIDRYVQIELQSFALDDVPVYQAISYEWRRPESTCLLICNGVLHKTNGWLLVCLLNVYHVVGSAWLWVDAISIHQSDEVEKAAQVSLMWKIFSSAARVLVYLGVTKRHSSGIIDTRQMMDRLAGISENIVAAAQTEIAGPDQLPSLGLPYSEDPFWQSLSVMMTERWFQRLWTVQEAVLAKELMVVYGRNTIPWEQLYLITQSMVRIGLAIPYWKHLQHSGPLRDSGFITMSEIQAIRLKGRAIHGEKWTWFVPLILKMTRTRNVTEPIDRVYAILGTSSKDCRAQIPIDYSRPSREDFWKTYVAFFKALIPYCFSTIFTLLASEQNIAEMPSWCPNLNSLPAQALIIPHRPVFELERMPNQFFATLKVGEGTNELEAIGMVLDVIGETTLLHWSDTEPGNAATKSQAFLDCESDCAKIASKALNLVDLESSPYADVLFAEQGPLWGRARKSYTRAAAGHAL